MRIGEISSPEFGELRDWWVLLLRDWWVLLLRDWWVLLLSDWWLFSPPPFPCIRPMG
jgi:hypothetical protein